MLAGAAVLPKRLGVAGLFASFDAPALPPPKRPGPGVALPAGFAAAPPPNIPVEPDGVAVAGFAPKRLPPVWLLCPPNRDEPVCVLPAAGVVPKREPDPGGGPAGVVEGRKLDLGAGVASGAGPVSQVYSTCVRVLSRQSTYQVSQSQIRRLQELRQLRQQYCQRAKASMHPFQQRQSQ